MADTTPKEKPPERKPWAMIWVVVAIATYIVFYTAINVFFRKPSSESHEPAAEAEARQRAFVQASMNDWTRYAVRLGSAREDSELGATATVARAPAPADLAKAVPTDLTLIFPGKPSMHVAPAQVVAPATVSADGVWRAQLEWTDPQKTAAFGESLAYAKDNHLRVFLQDEERPPYSGDLITPASTMEVTLPARVLSAGNWTATLYTKDKIFTWSFVVPESAARLETGH